MSTGLSSLKASEDALNQGNLSTISTATSRTIGCPICSSLVGANIAKNHLLSWNNSEKKCIVCGKNCGKPALLDLFSGAGGAARGYQRAGFCVLGVDIKPQPHYAGCRFVQADAMTYPLDGFDVIHASPPCQAFTALKTMPNAKEHKSLIEETRQRLKETGKPYIMENVIGSPLIPSVILCGTMFGLGTGNADLWRHRIFETNFHIGLVQPCNHGLRSRVIGVYGGHGRDRRRTKPLTCGVYGNAGGKSNRDGTQQFTTSERAEAMGIDWMTGTELSQAIPPAYTEWIGRQLMEYLGEKQRGLKPLL